MGFLGRLIQGGKRFLGKLKSGLGAGLRIFDKAKDKYQSVKSSIANLPVVGTAAAELIRQGESKLGEYSKQKGVDPAMLQSGLSMARKAEAILPTFSTT
jgi:hypothetical protein